jgi:hypothetical protein
MLTAITQAEVIRKMLCHLKRAADPSPIALARARQAPCDWVASAQPSRVDSEATCAQRRDVSPRYAVAIPFAIGHLQPFYVARSEAVPPGHPEALPYSILRRLSSTSAGGAAPRAARAMRTTWPLMGDAEGDAAGRSRGVPLPARRLKAGTPSMSGARRPRAHATIRHHDGDPLSPGLSLVLRHGEPLTSHGDRCRPGSDRQHSRRPCGADIFLSPYATDSSTETRFPSSAAWRVSW